MRNWLLLLGTGLAFGAGLWSCSSDTDGNTTGAGASSGTAGNGGAGTGGTMGACIPGLTSIALSPANQTVMLDGGPAAPVPFTATGTFSDGTTRDLDAASLTWTATRDDATPPGTIESGVLQPYPTAGGTVRITAADGCATGETTVLFYLDVTLGMPSDPGPWSGMPVTGAPSPLLVYPSDQTRFPRNLYRTLFQWRSQGFTEFRMTFEGPNSTVTVYTDGAHGLCAQANPAAGCWEVDELAWDYIAGSNAGATAVWTVDALDTSTTPATVRRSDPVEIGFSLQDVQGAIFYWSTTSAGIRRGKISKPDPEDYIVAKPTPTTYDGDNKVKCVACHVVSRDGQYMAAPVSADSGQSLWILQVTQDAPPTPLVTSIEDTGGHGFATISPDNERVVAAWGGRMWMVERATGTAINDLPLGALDGTHPDWSPLGDEVVFATGSGDGPGNASLARISYMADDWGQPQVFLPPPSGKSNLFPMFSPSGEWIAFSQGKGGHGDPEAQLMVIASAGGDPIELINANRVTSNQVTDGQYQNSQPTWAPPGDLHWVAFNTKREYGVVLDEGTQQIWVAAIDVEKAAAGVDPSYPAFRVPFQGLNENNHRAYWTLDVGDGMGGGGGAGGGGMGCTDILTLGEACDPLNDCCETGSLCDTPDSGMTYVCMSDIQ